MKKTNRQSSFYPDYIAGTVLEIRADELISLGITHVAFDIDETVVPSGYHTLTAPYVSFLGSLEKNGLKLLIASNSSRDLSNITQHFNAVVIKPSIFSFKPFRHYYHRVIKASGTDAGHIAMVGDKLLNDVIGAKHAGLLTILVAPFVRRQKFHHKYYFRLALRQS